MPELPLAARVGRLTLRRPICLRRRRSISKLSYDNADGNRVEAECSRASRPSRDRKEAQRPDLQPLARTQLLSLTDIEPRRRALFKADVTVDGKGLSMRKIGGIVPARFVQQSGFAAVSPWATYRVVPEGRAGRWQSVATARWSSPCLQPERAKQPVELDDETKVKMAVAQELLGHQGLLPHPR